MKKVWFGLALILSFYIYLSIPPQKALAIHTLIGNADNLTSGTVPNARLDASSVTLAGPAIYVGSGKKYITANTVFVTSTVVGNDDIAFNGSQLNLYSNNSSNLVESLTLTNFNNGGRGNSIVWRDSEGSGKLAVAMIQAQAVTVSPTKWRLIMGAFSSTDTFVITESSQVGIGTLNPAAKLDIRGVNDTTLLQLRVTTTQAGVTTADTFIDFISNTGSEGSIAGTGVAGVIAYNTFTGSHYTEIEDKTGLEILMLLEATGEKITEFKDVVIEKEVPQYEIAFPSAAPVRETFTKKGKLMYAETVKSGAAPKAQLVKSRICSTAKSKAAWGVYGGTDREGRDLVMSIGTAFALVTNKGKDVEIGDYLTSSDVAGHMELQDDDLIHNYTVGKALEPIIWESGETERKIAVTLHGG